MRRSYALLALLALTLAAASAARAQGERRAGLVVQYGDGSVQTACVRFPEEEISGVELLDRSGLPTVVQSGGMGAAVCKIGPDGCDYPAESCFCRRDGARSIYWAFYTLAGDAWAYANLGAANTRARDGDVHGWAWGAGDSSGGALPPALSIEAVCAPAAPPPSPEPPTAPPATEAPATEAPATEAPATAAPATAAPPATEPPATEPPATEPPATEPPATELPATEAPATAAPPATEPPAAEPTSVAAGGELAQPTPAGGGGQGAGPGGLLGFGAIALILAAGVALAARRRAAP